MINISCFNPNIILKYKDGSIKFLGSFKNAKGDPLYQKYTLDYDKVRGIERILVPCGHCVGCRMDYSRQWANRCYFESLDFENNYFITLTYDDDHIPLNEVHVGTLKVDHFTKFIKDLRNYFKYNFDHDHIRFFGCGEYGDTTFRPHYHILLFNLPLNDLSEFIPFDDNGKINFIQKFDKFGQPYMYSDTLKNLWPYGNILVGGVSWKSSAYVARYIFKKYTGDFDVYKKLGIEPVFIRMSRKPGIGYNYISKHYKDVYKSDKLYLHDGQKNFISRPGRYYDNVLKVLSPVLYENVKLHRSNVLDRSNYCLYKTSSLSMQTRLSINLRSLENKIKIFKRDID